MEGRQWGKLTDDHLDQDKQLVGKVQECYGIRKWEGRNHDVFAETSAEVRKHVGIEPTTK